MIHSRDCHVQVDHDELGFVVAVTHKITGLRRQERHVHGEPVYHVQEKLIAQIQAELFNPEDFECVTGRCVVKGEVGTFYGITHKPTGKARTINSVEHRVSKTVHVDLLDELVALLWQEKSS